MSEIGNTGALGSVLNEYAIVEPPKTNELGRDEFLKLLVVQLQNQNPLDPQGNGDFIAQLAQFSSLEEQQNLSAGFEKFAKAFQSSQHLQATSLVGRPVHVQSRVTHLSEEGGISVLADIPSSTHSATLTVYNEAGAIVDNFELGPQQAGRREFIWSGVDGDDRPFPPGSYTFSVDVTVGGEAASVPIYLSSNVNSVTIEPGGTLTLNLAGIGPTPLSEVVQIN